MVTFSGRLLRQRRREAGVSPEQLAVAIGYSAFSVNLWERGKAMPRTPLLGPICTALGVQLADLFEETGPDAA